MQVAERRAAEAEEEQERAELDSQAANSELKAALQGRALHMPPPTLVRCYTASKQLDRPAAVFTRLVAMPSLIVC